MAIVQPTKFESPFRSFLNAASDVTYIDLKRPNIAENGGDSYNTFLVSHSTLRFSLDI